MERMFETPVERLFYSPLLGMIGGAGIIVVGALWIRFSPQVSRFYTRWLTTVFGRRYADWLGTTQLARIRITGILVCLFGTAVLIIAIVSVLQGL